MSDSHDVEAIVREMSRVRCNFNEGVEGIVDSARVMSDWRYYVREYPWASVGLAAAVGYLVVPNRVDVMRPDAETLEKMAKRNRLLVKPENEPQKRGGLTGALLTLLTTALMKGMTSYVGQVASQAVSQQAAKMQNRQAAAYTRFGAAPPTGGLNDNLD